MNHLLDAFNVCITSFGVENMEQPVLTPLVNYLRSQISLSFCSFLSLVTNPTGLIC